MHFNSNNKPIYDRSTKITRLTDFTVDTIHFSLYSQTPEILKKTTLNLII